MLPLLLAAVQGASPSDLGDLTTYLGPFAIVAVFGGGVIRYLVKQSGDKDQVIADLRQEVGDANRALLEFSREMLPVVTQLTSEISEVRRDIERMERR